MKIKYLLLFCLLSFFSVFSNAQDQTVKGNLYVGEYNSSNGYGSYIYLRGNNWNNSSTWMARYTFGDYNTDFRVHMGAAQQHRFTVGAEESGRWVDYLVVNRGKVGINGIRNLTHALEVNGTIRAKEIIVETGGTWSDFVFAPDYNLPSLKEVEAHIKEHKHLPEIPSEAEVLENGIGLGEMNVKLLQKIEELTLYLIQQNKEIESLKTEIYSLKK